MLELLTLPMAAILGFLAGLGVGGGSLLMIWLTVVAGLNYTDARTINLLFFLPSAAIATVYHHKQGSVEIKKILKDTDLNRCTPIEALTILADLKKLLK